MGSHRDRSCNQIPIKQAGCRCHTERVLDVPAGLGKTEGIVLGCAYRRGVLGDEKEPRHFIYGLPVRVPVWQTDARLRAFFENLRSSDVLPLDVAVDVTLGGDV